MRNYTAFFPRLIIFVWLGLLSARLIPLAAEDPSSEESGETREEAPEALWSASLDDKEVSLYAAGSWRLTLLGGGGYYWQRQGLEGEALFPGLTSGYLFEQLPDLTLSLYLMDRYFLETSFTEGWDKNTYLLGYDAPPESEETLRRVRLGNTAITMDTYASQPVFNPRYNSPGLALELGTPSTKHEFLLRYDQTAVSRKSFIGSREVSERDIPGEEWIRGRFFLLPDKEWDEGTLRLYAKDTPSPDSYQRLQEGTDYQVSPTEGTLSLTQAPEGPVALYYEKGGLPVGTASAALGQGFLIPLDSAGRPDPGGSRLDYDAGSMPADTAPLGTRLDAADFDDLSGTGPILLYLPGRYSPFERACFYSASGSSRFAVYPAGGGEWTAQEREALWGSAENNWVFRGLSRSSVIELRLSGEEADSARGRYPFIDLAPGLYGTYRETEGIRSPAVLREISQGLPGRYQLDTDIIPGSVTVTRNGQRETNWTLDDTTGKLEFTRPIYPGDRIEITYRREDQTSLGGSLLAGQGNRFQLTPPSFREGSEDVSDTGWIADSALLFQWNLLPGQYTQPGDTRQGQLTLAGEVRRRTPRGQADFLVKGELLSTDTTGTCRLAGMEEEGLILNPDAAALTGSAAQGVDVSPLGPALTLSYDMEGGERETGGFLLSGDSLDLSNRRSLILSWMNQADSGSLSRITLEIGSPGKSDHITWKIDTDDTRLALPGTSWQTTRLYLTREEQLKLSQTEEIRVTLESAAGARGLLRVAGLFWEGASFAGRIRDNLDTPSGRLTLRDTSPGLSSSAPSQSLEALHPETLALFHPLGETQKILEADWEGLPAGGGYWEMVKDFSPLPAGSYRRLQLYVCAHDIPASGTLTLSLGNRLSPGLTLSVNTAALSEGRWQQWTADLESEKLLIDGDPAGTLTLTAPDEGGPLTWSRLSMTLTNNDGSQHTGRLWVDEIHLTEPSLEARLASRGRFSWARPDWRLQPGGFPLLAHPSLVGTLETAYSLPLSAPAGYGEGGMSHRLMADGALEVAGTALTATYGHTHSQESGWASQLGGHQAVFPAPRFNLPLSLTDIYQRRYRSEPHMTRRMAAALETAPLKMALSGECAMDSLDQQKRWRLSLNTAPFTPLNLKTDLEQTWQRRQYADTRPPGNHYLEDWLLDTPLLIPETGPPQISQEWEGSQDVSWGSADRGGSLKSRFRWYQAAETPRKEEEEAEFTLSGTFKLQPQRPGFWSLTPELIRRGQSTETGEDEGKALTFSRGWQRLGREISLLAPFYAGIPLFSLMDSAARDQFLSLPAGTGVWTFRDEAALTASRPPGSRLSYLVLPTGGSTRWVRSFTREGDSLAETQRWESRLHFTALNLLGRRGSYPLLPGIEEDEYRHSWTLILEGTDQLPPLQELTQSTYIDLRGDKDQGFRAESRSTWSWETESYTQDFRFSVDWKKIPDSPPSIPLVLMDVEKKSYYRHSEGLEGSFVGSDAALLLLLSHETRLVMPTLGYLSGRISGGAEGLPEQLTLGWELSLTLTVEF